MRKLRTSLQAGAGLATSLSPAPTMRGIMSARAIYKPIGSPFRDGSRERSTAITGSALPHAPSSLSAGVTALNAGTHSPGNASAPIAIAVATLPGKPGLARGRGSRFHSGTPSPNPDDLSVPVYVRIVADIP